MHFDDATQARAACMDGNRLRIHGVQARAAQRVDYLVDDAHSAASLTALLLERIQA